MTVSLGLGILGLALFDSTGLGTALIPLWLLLIPGRVRVTQMLLFLATLAGLYFVTGVLLAFGATSLLGSLREFTANIPTDVLAGVLLAVSVLLSVAGGGILLRMRIRTHGDTAGSITRWREHAMRSGSAGGLVTLALVAFAVEVATMVPFFAAIGLLTTAGLSLPAVIAWVGVYCLVMMLPAAIATIFRIRSHDRVEPSLAKMDRWLSRNSPALAGTAFLVIGLVLAADASVELLT